MTLDRVAPSFMEGPEHSASGPGHSGVDAHAYAIAVGDTIVLLGFAFIGRWSHHELSAGGLWATLGTAAPFVVGWACSAAALGAYSAGAFRSHRSALRSVLLTWPPALVMALVIRSVVEKEIPAFAFVVVAFLFNLLLLSVWRTLAVALRRDESGHARRL